MTVFRHVMLMSDRVYRPVRRLPLNLSHLAPAVVLGVGLLAYAPVLGYSFFREHVGVYCRGSGERYPAQFCDGTDWPGGAALAANLLVRPP